MTESEKNTQALPEELNDSYEFQNEWRMEIHEWIESLQAVKDSYSEREVKELLRELQNFALSHGISLSEATLNTPYRNSIPLSEQPSYPGDIEMESKIENIIRWNAMAMVVQANKKSSEYGGHISTYASSATLYEVGFNHFRIAAKISESTAKK